eukprot:CAMPEP_0179322122 /NCGR_PEP_ID=MMETSP0797-20121207/59001_1 /TAXON_ID=47934 /ORGANISM="Dinophysis acuminata, Strain DAEP01" /LENGTH=31 /DNA_ID= /DNA_START= /DNA_END= /DNA_ORIENTATION=
MTTASDTSGGCLSDRGVASRLLHVARLLKCT